MAVLSKADARAALTLPYEDVPVPALGPDTRIRVRCLTALEKDKYDMWPWRLKGEDGRPVFNPEGTRGLVLSMTCVDDDFQPIFTAEEANVLRSDVAEPLFEAAQRIGGLNAKVEELKKALGVAQAGASRTT